MSQQNNSQKRMFESSMYPTWNFCCIKYLKSFHYKGINLETRVTLSKCTIKLIKLVCQFSCFSQWGEHFKQYRNQHLFMSSILHACAMDDIYCKRVILPLTRPLAHLLTTMLVWFVTAGYAVWAPFKFSSKSGFPRARYHIGFIFSCENFTDIDQISLCWKC